MYICSKFVDLIFYILYRICLLRSIKNSKYGCSAADLPGHQRKLLQSTFPYKNTIKIDSVLESLLGKQIQ